MVRDGLAISLDGREARLKWHRLRRSRAEPEFSAEVMADGFLLGASMELDLRVRGDGGFAVLHDALLDRETTGAGPVLAQTKAGLTGVRYRQSGLPLILSEGLAAMMPSAYPETLLQFDMKDDLATIGARGLEHLVDHFGRSAAPIIFSGGCLDLIEALAKRMPDVRRGIDPTDRLVEVMQSQGLAAAEVFLTAALRGPTAPDTCYLSWELVLEVQARGLDLVALCHAEGVKVDVWTYTLADPAGFSDAEWDQFWALMALGPDQITTDEAVATEAAWIARSEMGADHR
jgi:glycerophosphoryl diester phosphodiesterase